MMSDALGGRVRSGRWFGWLLVVVPLGWAAPALARDATPVNDAAPVKIYLDESRSLQLPGQVWFSKEVHRATRLTRVTDLITLDHLRKYDVMVVWNQIEAFAYSKEELAAVKTFVADGGGLLLIGTPGLHTKHRAKFAKGRFVDPRALPVQDFSMNALSGLFGLFFTNASRQGIPEFVQGPELTALSAIRDVRFQQPLACLVGRPRNAEVVATAFGYPVIAATAYGRGRVIVCGASRLFFKHGKLPDRKLHKHDVEIAAQQRVLLHWLDWLAAGSPVRADTSETLPHRIPGRVCLKGTGLVVYTIPQMKPAAEQLMAYWKKVWPELSRTTGLSSPVELVNGTSAETPLEVYLCSAKAGGLSGSTRVCIPGMGDDERLVAVLAHEVGHKLLGGCNTSVSEAFAEWCSIKGLHAAGLHRRGQEKLQWKLQAFRSEDPTGRQLNFMDHVTDVTKPHACQGKWIWILMELEKKHGDRFLTNYLKALRRQVDLCGPSRKQSGKKKTKITMADHVSAMSEAAGEDLTPWLESMGISREK